MSRLLAAALAAVVLLAGAARAQDEKKPAAPAAPAPADVDPKTKAAIDRAVEKAKDDLRDEVRAEIQGAQAAAEFMGAVAEGPKLEFLQLDGYFRVRGQLFNQLDLRTGTDASGFYLFPVPIQDPAGRASLATANMRLRLEPTLNISEHVRVRAQIDVLDNYVLGSSDGELMNAPGSPYPVPFFGATRTLTPDGEARTGREAIVPKRVWGEVQTPLGLLSFGRMPSHWGLGILANAAPGMDDDLGDTVDRIQFALPPVETPIGRVGFVPILDFDSEGVLHTDPRFPAGTAGQPFDAESGDDGRTFALKIARLDTDDEIRRKLERTETSVNFGAYYNYRTQRYLYPSWAIGDVGAGDEEATTPSVRRRAYGHVLDVWLRFLGPRWRVEAEAAGVYGHVGNPSLDVAAPVPEVLLRQWGGTLVGEYQLAPNRFTVGLEAGAASGDDAPGFGNVTSRTGLPFVGNPTVATLPNYGSLEGPQFGLNGDRTIRNFRFNPAYRVDHILWRYIIGGVTDAAFVKSRVRWDIFPGLVFDAAVVYSQALESTSTPSAAGTASATDPNAATLTSKGDAPLGVELDGTVSYTTGDGFQLFVEYGLLQPLAGLGDDSERAQLLSVGLVARF